MLSLNRNNAAAIRNAMFKAFAWNKRAEVPV